MTADLDDTDDTDERERERPRSGGLRGRLRAFRRRIRGNRTLDTGWRVVVFIVGSAVVLAGLVMFVTPGPGWVALILGLAILSTEFTWAERALHWAKQKAEQAAAKAFDPKTRKRNLLITAAVIVLLALAGWWWVANYGWPTPLENFLDWVASLP